MSKYTTGELGKLCSVTVTKDEFDQKLIDILKTDTWIIHWRSALPEPKHV